MAVSAAPTPPRAPRESLSLSDSCTDQSIIDQCTRKVRVEVYLVNKIKFDVYVHLMVEGKIKVLKGNYKRVSSWH